MFQRHYKENHEEEEEDDDDNKNKDNSNKFAFKDAHLNGETREITAKGMYRPLNEGADVP